MYFAALNLTMLNTFGAIHCYFISIWTILDSWDKSLFKLINGRLTNDIFDKIAPWWREQSTWYPLYISLLLYVIMKMKKDAWKWVLAFILTVTISDIVSSHILKDLVGRVRPCSEATLVGYCKLLIGRCPTSGSFTSSHASNHFAMAMFIFYTLRKYFGKFGIIFILWAASIAYAQVYVGVHYPFDVIGGAVLGIGIGTLMSKLYSRVALKKK